MAKRAYLFITKNQKWQHICLPKATNKLEMFAIRCEMNDLPSNFGTKTNCEMGCQNQIMNNEHMLSCPVLNSSPKKMNILQILNGTNKQKIQGLNQFNENNNRRKEHLRDSVLY